MAAATCSIGAIVCAAIATALDNVSKPLNVGVVILTAAAGALTGTVVAQFDLSEKWKRWSRLLKEHKLQDLWLHADETDEGVFRRRMSVLALYEPENSSVSDLERSLEPFPLLQLPVHTALPSTKCALSHPSCTGPVAGTCNLPHNHPGNHTCGECNMSW